MSKKYPIKMIAVGAAEADGKVYCEECLPAEIRPLAKPLVYPSDKALVRACVHCGAKHQAVREGENAH